MNELEELLSKPDPEIEEQLETIEYINTLMDEVKKYNLEGEVIYYALKYMKQNPEIEIREAFIEGFFEFMK